ncbi:MAG: TonB-dependent receptor [Flavobacteriaceae bacterium]|nr:TonB-dependent receptor [Flavobacteriaceae bacterium]
MKIKSHLTLLFVLIGAAFGFAQTQLSGSVTDANGQPIPGATIIVQGTNNGTTSDFDGNYTISIEENQNLVISYLGYATQTILFTGQDNVNISLVEDLNELDEIVITGYGTQKKSHLTGAISKITNEKLDQIAVSRVDDALVGQVSGVNIAATEGEAGSAPTIRIRGTGSISASSDPAIVVDGLVVDNDYLSNLDMNDVASFEILKDAASAAIYGSRGANGVILITTKEGEEGKTKFTYNSYLGFKEAHQSDAYSFSLADSAAEELAANGSISNQTQRKLDLGIDRSWQDVIFDGGTIKSHSFAVRGGNKKTKYSTALNFVHDEGVLLTDDFKKYNVKLKVDTKLNDEFSVGVNLSPSYTNRRRFDGSAHDILRQTVWLPLYLDGNTIGQVNRVRDGGKYANAQIGDYAIQRMFDDWDMTNNVAVTSGQDISNTSNTNPAAKVLERDRNDYKFKLYGSMYMKYKIAKGLNFKTTIAGDFQNTKQDRWQGVQSNRNGASAATYSTSTQNRMHFVTDNFLNFDREFNGHEISAILGFSAEKWDTQYESLNAAGYQSDLLRTISAGDPTTVQGASYDYAQRLISYVSRVNYAYNDKYLVSLSMRRDGFSSFGQDSKYGNFPAASLGWNIAKEDFLAGNEVVSNLKFRFSYGVSGNPFFRTGNVLVDSFPYLALLESSTAIVDGGSAAGFNPLNIANQQLQWESSTEINPGLDFGFFNNRITGSVEYYQRNSEKLLIDNPVSSTTGFSSALVNIGEVKNSGYEFEIRTKNVTSENFSWNTTVLLSANDNELVSFGDSDGQIQNIDAKRAAEWINSVGNPISSFYGWVVDRDIPLEFIKNPYHPIGAEAQDVYVKDLNGDGLIDDDDKTILGDPYADLVWSIANDFKIGNFDLSFMIQGSEGAMVRNMGDQYIFNHFNSAQDFDTATTPDQHLIKQKIFTNDIVQDASYIALRNINIGYRIPQEFLDELNVNSARIYASGQNLFYKTAEGYTGFNPESINTTSPTTYGYQRAGSPVFSTISLGLNIEF